MEQKLDVAAAVRELGVAACAAARELARASTDTKNRALHATAAAIRGAAKRILDANAGDVRQARADGADSAFLDRLTLSSALVEQMARGVEEVAALPDPVGAITESRKQPSGIEVARMRVPLGVIGIIYESRP
ncbi:MAG TPA: gamma-glutamyl-phosphate reductase, partial [Burkholderiales bacterium]|nr:gamma-glutamyl-phosphate reductase [Burkholderiales bacterium]